jgi:hypothetical protein
MAGETHLAGLLEGLLFPKIFKSFRMAIQPSKMAIAFAAVAVLCVLGRVMDTNKTVPTAPGLTVAQLRSPEQLQSLQADYPTQLHCYLADPENVKKYNQRYSQAGDRIGVFTVLWHFTSARFTDAAVSLLELRFQKVILNLWYGLRAAVWSFHYHPIYSIIYFAAALAVISVAGGAICRIAALRFAREEKPGLLEALKFGLRHFVSFFTAPLVPLAIIALFGVCIIILGLLANIPRVGELLLAIGLPAVMVAAVLMTLVLFGTAAGAGLMFPAVSFEVTDGFDAVSRAFNYVYAKPWRMGFYYVLTAFYGTICYLFVRLGGFVLVFVAREFLQLGVWADSSNAPVNKLTAIWPQPQFLSIVRQATGETVIWSESAAAFLVWLQTLVIFGLVVSFVISFYFCANTVIYALMRKHVDDTALQDVYTQLEQVQPPGSPDQPAAPLSTGQVSGQPPAEAQQSLSQADEPEG